MIFKKLLASTFLTAFGAAFSLLCIPLIAYRVLGASATEVGLIVAAELLPHTLFGLFAGVSADRHNRLRLIAVADGSRTIVLLLIWGLIATKSIGIPGLICLVFLGGIFDTLAGAAYYAAVASAVPRKNLLKANSKLATAVALAGLAGPPVAGLSLEILDPGTALLANAACFAISAMLLFGSNGTPVASSTEPRHIVSELVSGIKYFMSDRVLVFLLMISGTVQCLVQAHNATFTIYATSALSISTGVLGVCLTVGAALSMLASSLAGRYDKRVSLAWLLTAGIVIAALGWGLLGAAHANEGNRLFLFGAGTALFSVAMVLYEISIVSLRQSVTPTHLHGRINSTARTFALTIAPVGAVGGGFIADRVGFASVFGALSVVMLTLGAALILARRFFTPISPAEMPQ